MKVATELDTRPMLKAELVRLGTKLQEVEAQALEYRQERDHLRGEVERWKENFEAMERAGAEQARRADENAAVIERLRGLCAARPRGDEAMWDEDRECLSFGFYDWIDKIDAAGRGE